MSDLSLNGKFPVSRQNLLISSFVSEELKVGDKGAGTSHSCMRDVTYKMTPTLHTSRKQSQPPALTSKTSGAEYFHVPHPTWKRVPGLNCRQTEVGNLCIHLVIKKYV